MLTTGSQFYIKRNLTATPTVTKEEWKQQITLNIH